jgi:hypothetical protein
VKKSDSIPPQRSARIPPTTSARDEEEHDSQDGSDSFERDRLRARRIRTQKSQDDVGFEGKEQPGCKP